MHLHTLWSDGIYPVHYVLAQAKVRGFDFISITDHNEVKGSLKAMELAPKYDLKVILGIELYFRVERKVYELLAYFPQKNEYLAFFNKYRENGYFMPSFGSKKEIVELILSYNGFVIIPHPYGKNGFLRDEERINGYGALGLEDINASTGDKLNDKSHLLTHSFEFGGADMHVFPSSLDRAFTLLRSNKKITTDLLWNNFYGKEESIEFIPVGNTQPIYIRYFKHFVCFFTATSYLTRQYVRAMYLSRKNR